MQGDASPRTVGSSVRGRSRGAAGAALGIAHRTAPGAAPQWVAAVLATTERADTAQFSYTNVTSSPNADLRGSVAGSGAVAFATGDARVTEVPAAFGDLPRGPVTTVATLTFSAFGIPVHVVAPPASALAPRGGSSVAFAVGRAQSCRS
jgi:hypothetical protein